MKEKRSILSIFAHPDDESYGVGGALAKYHDKGVRLILVTLTDGGNGSKRLQPGILPDAPLGECRLKELEMACDALGIDRLITLGFVDSGLTKTNLEEMIDKIVPIIQEERPDIVVTFHPNGLSGHPDHIITTKVTKAAFAKAAEVSYCSLPTHQTKKLYFYSLSRPMAAMLKTIYPQKTYLGLKKSETTTVVDTRDHVATRLRALQCHQTQFSTEQYGEDLIASRFFKEYFQRYYPAPQPKERREKDLFDGI